MFTSDFEAKNCRTPKNGRIGGRRTTCLKNIRDRTGIEKIEQIYCASEDRGTVSISIVNFRETEQNTEEMKKYTISNPKQFLCTYYLETPNACRLRVVLSTCYGEAFRKR